MMMEVLQEARRRGIEEAYECANLVTLRAPLFPVETYRAAFDLPDATGERLREVLSDPIFLEMLGIASPDLLERVAAFQRDPSALSPKRTDDLLGAVARYLIRATTRPTPFGAFAGVGAGGVGETARLRMGSLNEHGVFARFDYGDVLELVQKLEREPALRPDLQVYANPALFRWGERVYVDCRDSYGTGQPSETISVRATAPVLEVLAWAETPQPFEGLVARLREALPARRGEQIAGFLQSLLEQGILLSTLRPPLSDPDPLAYLLHALPCTYQGPQRALLEKMAADLRGYNQVPVGQGLQLLEELRIQAREIGADRSAHFQVDARLAMPERTLPASVSTEVAQAIQAMLRIWPVSTHSAGMQEYARAFIERYGACQEVPLLAVLNGEIGLGPPPGYRNPPPVRSWQFAPADISWKQKEWLSQLLGEALQSRSREIVLDEEALRGFEFQPEQLPSSLDAFVSLAACDAEAIDRGDYLAVLGAGGAASPASRAIGRFAYLEPAFRDHLHRMAAQEEEQNPDVIFADLIYTHPRGHANNVGIRPCLYRYQIAVATTPGVPFHCHIPLNDLLLGLARDRFYLRSKRTQKQVVVRTGNLLNPAYAPNAVRFIMEIAGGHNFSKIGWNWGAHGLMPFLPRVRYGKVVLAPARWRLQGAQKDQAATQPEALAEWRERFHVPRYLYLGEHDNRLLLDLDNSWHRKVLQRALQHGPAVVEEALPGLGDAPLKDSQGNSYMLEAVISLHLREAKSCEAIPTASEAADAPERIRLPGEDCLYLKLYGPASLQDDLLLELEAIIRDLVPETERWFFIRYTDPDAHLRLRLFGEPRSLLHEVFPKFCAALRPLYSRGLLTRASVDTYEREAARYGGQESVLVCEEIFASDSAALVSLLHFHRQTGSAFEWENLALLGLDTLFRGLGFETGQRQAIYQRMNRGSGSEDTPARRKYLSGLFRRRREAIRNQLCSEWIARQPGGSELASWVRAFENQLAGPRRDLLHLEHSGGLRRSRMEIAASLGHMHCNRAGLKPQDEQDCAHVLERVSEGLLKYAAEAVAT